ncbi:winged helix-turn-helix domain-containing protein [Tepidanaerobacter syntrophicus]|uniref:winged helix-turn-helix domain-containing protein n=1 Tax=Tepidanaerobacter syntrophicus TaxID=224999 RepID=UPI001BD381B5|nr:LysR family transcriptional regulator [Tepidanaerobacter syntrophicus]
MKLVYKIWIEGDNKAFGEGPYKLLKKVDQLGSIHKAAQDMNMSYSKAWSIIKRAERELGIILVESNIGGAGGGGSCLTSQARILLNQYNEFCHEAEEILTELYNKYFSELL